MSLYVFDDEIPNHLLCCITHELFEEPVYSPKTGLVYEKEAIYTWIQKNETCPITRHNLYSQDLEPALKIQNEADEWFEKHAKICDDPASSIQYYDILNSREVFVSLNHVKDSSILIKAINKGQQYALKNLIKPTHEQSYAFFYSLLIRLYYPKFLQASIPHGISRYITSTELEPANDWKNYVILFGTLHADHVFAINKMFHLAINQNPTFMNSQKEQCVAFIVSQIPNLPTNTLLECCEKVLDNPIMKEPTIFYDDQYTIGSVIANTIQEEFKIRCEKEHLYPLVKWLNNYNLDVYETILKNGTADDINDSDYIRYSIIRMFGSALTYSEGDVLYFINKLLDVREFYYAIQKYRPEVAHMIVENPPPFVSYETATILIDETLPWIEYLHKEISEQPLTEILVRTIISKTQNKDLMKAIGASIVRGLKSIPPTRVSYPTIDFMHEKFNIYDIAKENIDIYSDKLNNCSTEYYNVIRLGARSEIASEELNVFLHNNNNQMFDINNIEP